jgi:hypothetical protein
MSETTEIEVGQKWRHKTRGSVYEVLDTNAAIQCSAAPEFESMFEDDAWIAYRDVRGGSIVSRPAPEFLDGRFEIVEDSTPEGT